MKYLILFLTIVSPLSARAERVSCETLQQMLDVPDDQCAAIEDSAKRCFRMLNKHYADVRHIQNKKERQQVKSDLAADYEREILSWKQNIVYLSQIGEGRACTNEVGSVGVFIDEMESDLKKLRH